MQTYIALLRGINVGGRNRLPMSELKGVLASLGADDIKTYIQSGNVAFQGPDDLPEDYPERIGAAIDQIHGFTPEVLVLRLQALERAMAENPYREAESDPKSLHLFFLASEPENPDLAALDEVRTETERYTLTGRVFYLHAPDGIGRSRLASKLERALGVAATGRNWRSVEKIKAMAAS